jgi:hypothetical protein
MKQLLRIAFILSLTGCQAKCPKGSSLDISAIPAFDLLLADSVTVFSTSRIPAGSPVILMYFSPDCEHCQRQTDALVKHIESLRDVRIYLITPLPFGEMKTFTLDYHLSRYTNITVGQDYRYAFYKYYKAEAFPCTAIYDDRKQLIKLYRQELGIDRILETIHPQTAVLNH